MTAPDALRLVAYTAVYVGDDIVRDLDRIRSAAHRHNPADGISGALLFDRGRFIQAVEGPPAAIESLLGRVRSDACAGEMDVLFDCATRARSLQDWTLRVSHLGESPVLEGADLAAFRDAYLRNFRPDADGFISLVRALFEADDETS